MAGGEFLHQRADGAHDLVEIGLVVLEGRDQAVEDRIIEVLRLQMAHQGDGLDIATAQGDRQVVLLDAALERRDLFGPVRRSLPVEMGAGIFHEQGLDVVDVTAHLLVVRAAAERHQGARDDVDEAPGELLERGRVAFARQLVGDAGGHLGDAREVADGVVTRRHLGKAQMEEIEVLGSPGPLGLGIDAPQQSGVALGIEHDHHIAALDVLGDEEFGEPGLADAGGAEHQGVPDPLAEIHPDFLLVRFDGMQGGPAAERRQRGEGIPPDALTQPAREQAQQRHRLPGDFLAAGPLIEAPGCT